MGAVKEEAIERICKIARAVKKEEEELLSEWNQNLRQPEKMISIEEFLSRQTKK